MTLPFSRTAVTLPLAAFIGLSLLSALPAYAQQKSVIALPTSPWQIPLATDDAVASLGTVQGDVVVPFSNIETPDQIGVSLHTNILISRRSPTLTAAVAAPPLLLLSAALGSSLTSPLIFPVAAATLVDTIEGSLQPAATGSGPNGSFLPADLKKAYGLASTGGAGTIVLVGAYHYPTALSDFNAFSSVTGLPMEPSTNPLLNTNKVFQVVYATGRQPGAQPSGASFGLEAALDIEWAHAMAPNAKIVLVEATNNGVVNLLFGAVAKGNNLPGVRQLSISFGSSEFSTQTYFDASFNQPGVVYFASTGDTGGVINWPSSAPNVVGVGGTSLFTNSDQSYASETGWSGSGGGVSAYEAKPSYQSDVTLNGTTFPRRAVPDISLLADPNTGVYIVYNGSGYAGIGGTSLSSPALAGIVNLSGANRGSTNAQLTRIYDIYRNRQINTDYSSNFHDITSGTAGPYSCLPGFDLVTGIGTPLGVGGL